MRQKRFVLGVSMLFPRTWQVLVLATLIVSEVGAAGGAVRAFELTASRFAFEPAALEVNEGDTVRLTLRSADVTHGFAIKELKVKTAIPKGGEPVTVQFVAAEAGTYEFACSEYCGPGHRDMKGKLVVAPRAKR